MATHLLLCNKTKMDVANNIAAFLAVWSLWSLLDLSLHYSPWSELMALLLAGGIVLPWKFVWSVMCVRTTAVREFTPENCTLDV